MSGKPIQHTPKHLEVEGVNPKHPAASAFAPVQPGAGVVADDAHEDGQNLAGGTPASEAHEKLKDADLGNFAGLKQSAADAGKISEEQVVTVAEAVEKVTPENSGAVKAAETPKKK